MGNHSEENVVLIFLYKNAETYINDNPGKTYA